MAKLIFKYTDDDYIEHAREASEIEFTIPDELNIFEFKLSTNVFFEYGLNPIM